MEFKLNGIVTPAFNVYITLMQSANLSANYHALNQLRFPVSVVGLNIFSLYNEVFKNSLRYVLSLDFFLLHICKY